MSRQKTTEEFIVRAKSLYGDLFDYSKSVYIKSRKPIIVTCKKHGDFVITPDSHLKGHGCPYCRVIVKRDTIREQTYSPLPAKKQSLIYGIAQNDLMYSRKTILYKTWFGMIRRCYDPTWIKKHPTYSNVSVCNEWLSLSSFKPWFDENYVEGYALDKDILVKGNKVYSPETCCFVPQEINNLLLRHEHKRGTCCIGVFKTKTGNYQAYYRPNIEAMRDGYTSPPCRSRIARWRPSTASAFRDFDRISPLGTSSSSATSSSTQSVNSAILGIMLEIRLRFDFGREQKVTPRV